MKQLEELEHKVNIHINYSTKGTMQQCFTLYNKVGYSRVYVIYLQWYPFVMVASGIIYRNTAT